MEEWQWQKTAIGDNTAKSLKSSAGRSQGSQRLGFSLAERLGQRRLASIEVLLFGSGDHYRRTDLQRHGAEGFGHHRPVPAVGRPGTAGLGMEG